MKTNSSYYRFLFLTVLGCAYRFFSDSARPQVSTEGR